MTSGISSHPLSIVPENRHVKFLPEKISLNTVQTLRETKAYASDTQLECRVNAYFTSVQDVNTIQKTYENLPTGADVPSEFYATLNEKEQQAEKALANNKKELKIYLENNYSIQITI